MLYTLITTISAPHPTDTPIAVSLMENLTDLPLWIEIVGIAASVILGIAASIISIIALVKTLQQSKLDAKSCAR